MAQNKISRLSSLSKSTVNRPKRIGPPVEVARPVSCGLLLDTIEDTRERYRREKDQAILKDDMVGARWALAALECCDRIERILVLRFGVSVEITVSRK